MATRSNRAATAANKRGGKRNKRNASAMLLDPHQSIDKPKNREAFLQGRHETVARMRNASTTRPTEPSAPGIPEGRGFTPKRHGTTFREHRSSLFKLQSPVFSELEEIPTVYTQEGSNLSPPLHWVGEPPGTEEFILVCEDQETPEPEHFIHWLVYRILPSVSGFSAGLGQPKEQIDEVVGGPLQGHNSLGTLGYLGPLPPYFDDWHHYVFRLFSLEAPLKDLRPGMSWQEIRTRMEGHVLEESRLVGKYRRSAPTKRTA